MSRGTDQWTIFLDDHDRRHFLRLLKRMCDKHGVYVVAYCLMGNHFHLVLFLPDGGLADCLRDLKSSYARYFNDRHHRTGPLFRDRYTSKPVVDEAQLVATIRYVHRNPLDLDPNINLANAPWSSHGIYLNLRPTPSWLRSNFERELFGASYQQFVETPLPHDKVRDIPDRIVPSPGAGTIALPPVVTLVAIREAVAMAADCRPIEVRPRAHNGLIGIAISLAIELTDIDIRAMAEPFGFKSKDAVKKQLTRSRQRAASDPQYARLKNDAVDVLRRRAA